MDYVIPLILLLLGLAVLKEITALRKLLRADEKEDSDG